METDHCDQKHDSSYTAGDTFSGLTVLHDNIFKVAYDDEGQKSSTSEASSGTGFYMTAIKLLCDMLSLAPGLLFSYYFCTLWESIEPTFKLYLSASLLAFVSIYYEPLFVVCSRCQVEHGVLSEDVSPAWLLCLMAGYLIGSFLSAMIKNFQ